MEEKKELTEKEAEKVAGGDFIPPYCDFRTTIAEYGCTYWLAGDKYVCKGCRGIPLEKRNSENQ